ncbi:MAG: Holliday junction resolvase RuvX [Ruminococcus sp.]|nr:Holliday junction resolvase RuvX [Candidatus Apopatosoma intestinale]
MEKKILGVDYGMARTGLACSDELGMYAHGIGNIKSYVPERAADEIVKKAEELGVSLIVIGKPVNMDGSCGEKAQSAMALGAMISERTTIPVELYDERCTTVLAHKYLRESGLKTKNHRDVVDSLAAQIILQDFMDRQKVQNNKEKKD